MLRRLGYSFLDHAACMRAQSYLDDNGFDPAYSARIFLPGGGTLGFHVCFLGPYYGVHRTGAPAEEPAVSEIAQEIEATYPGYQPIPPDQGEGARPAEEDSRVREPR